MDLFIYFYLNTKEYLTARVEDHAVHMVTRANPAIQVIPAPAEVSPAAGIATIDKTWYIVASPVLAGIAGFLQATMREESGLDLPITNEAGEHAIELRIDAGNKIAGDEGYLLEVEPAGIKIVAPAPAGAFHGVQTLRQLLPLAGDDPVPAIDVPAVRIRDAPRFSWRGFMLDVARHFFDAGEVMRLIDALALLKLDVLHLHLCDDQGWRLEIEQYPRLIEVGATRPESHVGGFLSKKTDGIPHAGHFTRQDIRSILDHAASRFVTVVPEIELPGHCSAALAAYPHLGCTGGPYAVATKAGIKKDVYCAGKDATFTFLEGVLCEVIDTFPSPWIHLGGDEVPKDRWRACPDCQARIKAEGLRDEGDLQAWFVNKLVAFVERRGKTAVGWNEILSDRLPPSVIGQHWLRGRDRVVKHLRRGGKIIGSQFFHSYLDYNHGVVPLSKVYAYDPVPRGLDARHRTGVVGIEAPMWTEFAATPAHVHAFVFPRLAAVAENAWTPVANGRDLSSFTARLPPLLARLRRMGIAHASIRASQPPLLERLLLWTRLTKQSSELPGEVQYP